MTVVENFAELSAPEQYEFAAKLLNTINSEHIFTSDTDFEILNVEVSEYSGDLRIDVSHTNLIDVPRKAVWTCSNEDEAEADPGYDADFDELIDNDVAKVFKTREADIEGYHVVLEVGDADAEETVEVTAEHISHEDSGIGHYEYWGEIGYDSKPYVEVEGVVTQACTIYPAFFVSPVTNVPEETSEEN